MAVSAIPCGDVQRRGSIVLFVLRVNVGPTDFDLRIDVCPAREQRFDGGRMASARCDVQRRDPVFCFRVDEGAGIKQRLDGGELAKFGRDVQRRGAVFSLRVDVGSAREQCLDGDRGAIGRCHVERRGARLRSSR